MNGAATHAEWAEAHRESFESKALALLAVALVFVGLVGLVLSLVFRMSPGNAGALQGAEAEGLALLLMGLSLGCLVWWQSRRKAQAFARDAARLTRIHAVMSQTNRLILKRPDPHALLKGVCEVCVRAGHMERAVVDMLDVGEAHRVTANVCVPSAVTNSPLPLLEGAHLQTLMTTMVENKGQCVVVDDASVDKRLNEAGAWCLANGLLSFAAVPLRRGGVLVGILLLGTRTASYFAGAVLPLLSELGADLSFALDNADRERERHAALRAEHAHVAAEDASRAKTEFLGQMSHELRTPLNAMLGFAQLLATDELERLSTVQAERVRLITHAGWHLLGLVNDVMDISRIESRRLDVSNVEGDISGVLDEALALTQPLARAHQVELSERTQPRCGIGAVADPRRLQQVLLNLLSNACKYNRPGGRVRVDVRHAGSDVFLDVVDNGVGMTKEQLSHLFEPFNRLGHDGHGIEGSGIGLTLTRHLVELMKGRLDIRSSPESGTCARLVLPSCAIPPTTAGEDPDDSARVQQDAAVVLYIEDEPVNRILVEHMLLRCEGVQLIMAETGEDGIAMARQNSPDLVLLDMQLPDMTGFEVLDALRSDSRTSALTVVAVSANAMPADVGKARDFGAVDYWTKPLKMDAFVSGVKALLADSASTSAHARGQQLQSLLRAH